jgi:ABC-type multidrug transport system fused ATPase/permease subunit
MFIFSPYRTPGRQRLALLDSTSFADIPLHPAIEAQIREAGDLTKRKRAKIKGNWSLFFSVLSELSSLVWELVTLSVLSAVAMLASVLLVRLLFKASLSFNLALGLTALYLLLRCLRAVVEYINTNRRLQIHRGVQLALYRMVNEKLVAIAPHGRLNFSSGQLKTLVGSDVEAIEDFISAALMQWTPAIVSTLVLVPAIVLVSGVPGAAGLIVGLSIVPIAALCSALVERFQVKAQEEQDRLTTTVGEWIKNIRLVRFLGWDGALEDEVNTRMRSYNLRAALKNGLAICVWGISHSWGMFPLITIIAVSIWLDRGVNLIEVFSSLWLLEHLMHQIQYIPHSLSMYGSACAGSERLKKLLSQPEMAESFKDAEGLIAQRIIGADLKPVRLELTDVTHSFNGEPVLRNISAAIDLGSRTAIVGSVGSGKSTLIEVLIGELPFSSGSVRVHFSDGTVGDLWERDIYSAYRREIAYSPQQPFLSNASMRDNIDLSGEASLEELQLAVSLANLDHDIALFPGGLAEEVGESGINLSGGQRQRVSLGRAFISKRTIAFLDDPLSAVDPDTERKLVASIFSAMRGLVIVSHRLAELERCDRVIVLEGGEIVEDGDPKILMRDDGSRFSEYLRALEVVDGRSV